MRPLSCSPTSPPAVPPPTVREKETVPPATQVAKIVAPRFDPTSAPTKPLVVRATLGLTKPNLVTTAVLPNLAKRPTSEPLLLMVRLAIVCRLPSNRPSYLLPMGTQLAYEPGSLLLTVPSRLVSKFRSLRSS